MNTLELPEIHTGALEEWPTEQSHPTPSPGPADRPASKLPPRPAWIEVDLRQLKRNFQILNDDKPAGLQVLSVVKDEAYGHGAWAVARTALECGARFLGLATLSEAIALREKGV